MQLSKKTYIGIITFLTVFLVFVFFFSYNGTETRTFNERVKSGDLTLITSESTENSFVYYRDKLFNMMNYTLETYESLSENDTKIVNNYIYALWGYENGSLTEEEARAICEPNSPETWFNLISLIPLWEGSILSNTDAEFRVAFRSRAPFGERIMKVDVYLDKNGDPFDFSETSPTVQQMQMVEMIDFPDKGHISGKSWTGHSWYDVFNNYHFGACYHWGLLSDNVDFEAYVKPGYIDNWVKFVVRYEWQWHDIFQNTWHTQPVLYSWYNFKVDLDYKIDIVDDDTTPPILGTLHTYIYRDDVLIYDPPYIWDNESVLIIGGVLYEESSLSEVELKIDGEVIPQWTTINGMDIIRYWHIRLGGFFYIYITFPGYFYDLGTHTATITLTDGDNDRPNDAMVGPPSSINFEIKDDDTIAPVIHEFFYNDIIKDSDPYLKVKFNATDASGIYDQVTYVYDILNNIWDFYDVYEEEGYYCVDLPNPHVPNTYSNILYVWDADTDRQNDPLPTGHSVTFTVIDDDTTAPSVEYMNTWQIFDSEDYLEIKILATDDYSGIGEVYAIFKSIKYLGTYYVSDGYYHIFIPNPRTPGTYNLDIWVWNNDYDLWVGDTEYYLATKTFTVVDDDKTAPSVMYINDWLIYDSEQHFEVIILATEDKSGIGDVYAYFGGTKYMGAYDGSDGYYHINIPNPRTPGTYNLDIWVWNNDYDFWEGDTEVYHDTTQTFTVVDDDTTEPSVLYINDWLIYDCDEFLEIKILATEDISGIGDVYAYFGGTKYMGTYYSSDGYYHIFTPNPRTPGTYNLDIWVWNDDYDFWEGDTEYCHDTMQTFTVEDDDITAPEFDLIKGPMGDSGANVLLPFRIEATDESGISSIHVEIAGLIFTGPDWHYPVLPQGTYTMFVWVTDGDNDRIDDSLTSYQEFTIHLLKLDIEEWLTDSDFNPITHFDFIFRKDKPSGYTLVATNPGQFYYHIEVINSWSTSIDTLTIQGVLPPEFILKGAMPIHVYLDGTDVTDLCTIDYETCTIILYNINPGSMVYITIHMDFGQKGEHFESLADFILESFRFDTLATGEGALVGTFGSYSSLIGRQKKTTGICGFVTDLYGNPKANVDVLLYLGEEYIATAITDENGFYYFIDVDDNTNFTVLIGTWENPIMTIDVVTVKDDFVEANFYYQDI